MKSLLHLHLGLGRIRNSSFKPNFNFHFQFGKLATKRAPFVLLTWFPCNAWLLGAFLFLKILLCDHLLRSIQLCKVLLWVQKADNQIGKSIYLSGDHILEFSALNLIKFWLTSFSLSIVWPFWHLCIHHVYLCPPFVRCQ